MKPWVLLAVVAVGLSLPAWANDDQWGGGSAIHGLVCVEWADGGVGDAGASDAGVGADGGTDAPCLKYEMAYGCSTAGDAATFGWAAAVLGLRLLARRKVRQRRGDALP